jgi:DNA-binding transcriptional LysR family regulator
MNIELRQLRHFVALIEFRNFTTAAQAMKISQPAFSRSIQSLEQMVGARLINRQNPLEPTKKGLLVLEHARQLLQHSQELLNDIAAFNEKEAGEIRFGVGPAPAAWLLPQVVRPFHAIIRACGCYFALITGRR